MEISKISGNPYSLVDVVAIRDPKQQKLYIKNELYPMDMYTSTDKVTGEDKLVMLFFKVNTDFIYFQGKKANLYMYCGKIVS